MDTRCATGQLSVTDVDEWLRRALGCSEEFTSRVAAQRLFDAAVEPARTPRPRGVPPTIGPGATFWRLGLLLLAYLRVFERVHPGGADDATFSAAELARAAAALGPMCGPPLSEEAAGDAFSSLDRNHMGHVRLDEMCDWAVQRLLAQSWESAQLARMLLAPSADTPPRTPRPVWVAPAPQAAPMDPRATPALL